MRKMRLLGVRFGRLVVVKQATNDKYDNTRWECVCDCGTAKVITGMCLRDDSTNSCGCLQKEFRLKLGQRQKVNSYRNSNHYLYSTWNNMFHRCYNPKCKEYKYYGKRGIKICDAWLYNFCTFVSDMGERPNGMSIDRIDNDGNYEQNNCRWATPLQQSKNRRNYDV